MATKQHSHVFVVVTVCNFLSQVIFVFLLFLGMVMHVNPFAPGDFAEKRVLKLVEWFSGHCHAIKS